MRERSRACHPERRAPASLRVARAVLRRRDASRPSTSRCPGHVLEYGRRLASHAAASFVEERGTMPGGSNSAAGVVEGDVLEGKYRIERVLGVGGMGVVVAAHHIQLDEKVALKFLLPSALGNPDAVARFAREARAVVKIKSEHVARVSDVGALQDGAPYMVMEYLEGGDLEAWLQERGPLPIEQTVEFVLQACEAIAEAHALGIVHRDLKPANLFCIRRADGLLSIKVLAFASRRG